MEQLPQVVANGLVLGGTYALMAVGLTVIFGYLDLVNMAHGELYMIGGFFAYTSMVLWGLPFALAFPMTLVAAGVFGWSLDRTLIRPLRGKGHMPGILTTIGLSMVLQNVALIVWNPIPKRIPSPVSATSWRIGGVRLSPSQVMVALMALAIIAVAGWFMKATRMGRAVRATFDDPATAALMGISVQRVYGLTFAGGALLAAGGGALLGIVFLITPTMGELAVLKAFTVVILGGLGNFWGAAVAGLLIGLVESLTASYISSGYKDAVAFGILLGVLVLRPQGILGHAPAVEQAGH